MRKLASVQKIINLEPIEGKDRIELATILGYTVIVQKNEFKIGDLVIFCEPDSILPERKEFEFLRKRCYSKKWKGFRIKNMKMAGVYSSGIVFSLDLLSTDHGKFSEGKDISKLLNIKKYDPELLGEMKVNKKTPKWKKWLFKYIPFTRKLFKKRLFKDFPTHLIEKTDETRIQNVPSILEKFKGTKVFLTEKNDGQSGSYIWNKNKFIVCSRNTIVTEKNSNYWKIAEKYNIKEKLKDFCKKNYIKNIAIQGEIVGPGVSNGSGKNLYNLPELDFYIFNVIDINSKKHFSLLDMVDFTNEVEIPHVPILEAGINLDFTVKELLEKAKGKSKLAPVNREGIVIRDMQNAKQSIRGVGSTLSFKVINPDFSLEHKL